MGCPVAHGLEGGEAVVADGARGAVGGHQFRVGLFEFAQQLAKECVEGRGPPPPLISGTVFDAGRGIRGAQSRFGDGAMRSAGDSVGIISRLVILPTDGRGEIHCLCRLDLRHEGSDILRCKVRTVRPCKACGLPA